MKFDSKLIKKHSEEVAELISAIKSDINLFENETQKEDLISEICILEKYNRSLHKCISVYNKCEKEIYR